MEAEKSRSDRRQLLASAVEYAERAYLLGEPKANQGSDPPISSLERQAALRVSRKAVNDGHLSYDRAAAFNRVFIHGAYGSRTLRQLARELYQELIALQTQKDFEVNQSSVAIPR